MYRYVQHNVVVYMCVCMHVGAYVITVRVKSKVESAQRIVCWPLRFP